jgi:uncharacterized oligopeptide transporter (OPT) family protein
LGHQYNVGELYLWALSVAYFGVYFAVPMRKQMIEVEKLVFPSGTATAKTIEAMFATGGDDTVSKAKVLTIWGIGCGIWAVVTFFIPYLEVFFKEKSSYCLGTSNAKIFIHVGMELVF